MLKIYPTVRQTRRTRLCYVMDENDVLQFSAADMGDVLDWLWDNGHKEVEVHAYATVWTAALTGIVKDEEVSPIPPFDGDGE